MDKIIYTCSAEYIGYVFPKRKWWNILKYPREARMEWQEMFSGREITLQMRILEDVAPYRVWVPPMYQEEIWSEFIRQTLKKKRFEILMVIDPKGDGFGELLLKNGEDINYLAVLTENARWYEEALSELAAEYGLYGMLFTEYRDFQQYVRQICEKKSALVFLKEAWSYDNGKGGRAFFHFPKGSLIMDFGQKEDCPKKFLQKRMENDYASMPIFLDNIVKNRYNSVVNEGLQNREIRISRLQQNVYRAEDKNKLSEKRKGIKKWKKKRTS